MASRAQRPDDPVRAAGPRANRPRATRNPASAVYGTVLAGSLIAVEGARDDVNVPRLVTVVLVTQCVYWLAHSYSELIGGRINSGQRPRRGEITQLLREDWSLVTASFVPLAVTVLGWAAGVPANSAVLAGLWANVATLAGWALLAGRRARLRSAELLLYVVVSAVFGIALVLLKILVH